MNCRELLEKFNFIGNLPGDERNHLLNEITCRGIPAGQMLVCENSACPGVALVVSGEIRIFKTAENGKEISLYSVRSGETCVMTIACLLGFNRNISPVSAVAVSDSRIAVIPADTFRYLYADSPCLQQFIAKNIFNKFYGLVNLVESLSFQSVADRISGFIELNTDHGKKPLYITHAQLGQLLGTSREVVTRKLRLLGEKGRIKTQRGKIIWLSADDHARGTSN